MATAWPYFATPARTCVQRASSPRASSGGVRRSAMTTAPSCPQNLMARALLLQYRRLPPESEPSGMTPRAIWFLLGRRNEPLATDLIGIHSRYHDLVDT